MVDLYERYKDKRSSTSSQHDKCQKYLPLPITGGGGGGGGTISKKTKIVICAGYNMINMMAPLSYPHQLLEEAERQTGWNLKTGNLNPSVETSKQFIFTLLLARCSLRSF